MVAGAWNSAKAVCYLAALCTVLLFSAASLATGVALTAYVFASRAWLPERAVFTRPLVLSYTNESVSASVAFLRWHQRPDGAWQAPQTAAFLDDGQKLDVDVELTLPERPENAAVFMLHCTLSTDGGASLRESQTPVTLTFRSPLVRTVRRLMFLPLHLSGLMTEQQVKRLAVVRGFTERAAAPLAAVQLRLAAADPQLPPPFIDGAKLVARVNSGWLMYILSLGRLHPALHVLLFILAASLILLAMLACVLACLLLLRSAASAAAHPEVCTAGTQASIEEELRDRMQEGDESMSCTRHTSGSGTEVTAAESTLVGSDFTERVHVAQRLGREAFHSHARPNLRFRGLFSPVLDGDVGQSDHESVLSAPSTP